MREVGLPGRGAATLKGAASVEQHSDGQHTPGPWRVFKSTDGRVYLGVGDQDGGGILDGGFGTWRSGKEQLANAHLAAAAPDLRERLQAIIDWCDFAMKNAQEFDSHGVRNLDGPVFDAARSLLAEIDRRTGSDQASGRNPDD